MDKTFELEQNFTYQVLQRMPSDYQIKKGELLLLFDFQKRYKLVWVDAETARTKIKALLKGDIYKGPYPEKFLLMKMFLNAQIITEDDIIII